jgi:hypothetical protein
MGTGRYPRRDIRNLLRPTSSDESIGGRLRNVHFVSVTVAYQTNNGGCRSGRPTISKRCAVGDIPTAHSTDGMT